MKIYFIKFSYGGGADDALYYGGSISNFFSSRKKAEKELKRVLSERKEEEKRVSLANLNRRLDGPYPDLPEFVSDNDFPISGEIYAQEVF